jgi:hypothetical protein
MLRRNGLAALALAVVLGTSAASAATPSHPKVSMKKARATALARVPGGSVRSSELEHEKGKLVYSFDIAVAGKTGIDEVLVNAISGKVISVKHETPAAERQERLQEKAEPGKHPAKTGTR